MRWLVAAGKPVNDNRAVARQPPTTTTERWRQCFLFDPPRGYIAMNPGPLSTVHLRDIRRTVPT
jgi:hypothetical protein